MNSFGFNSTVTSQEAEALKEMIFKRARERAQAMTDEVQNSYTTSVHNDIMDLARDSFVAAKNPFSQKEEALENPQVEESSVSNQEIGFAQRQVHEIKKQINNKTNITNESIANKEVEIAMHAARNEFYKKQSFIGALDFLNSQASIALVKNRGAAFEAMA